MDTQVQAQAAGWQGLMAAKQIVQTINISRAHLHSLVKAHKFPQPALREGPRYTRWKASDVQAWLADPQAWIAAHSGVGRA